MQELPSIVVSSELPLYHLSSLFPVRRFTALLPSLVKHFLRISCSVALSAIRPQLTRSSAALGRPTSFTASQRQRQRQTGRQRDSETMRERDSLRARLTGAALPKEKLRPRLQLDADYDKCKQFSLAHKCNQRTAITTELRERNQLLKRERE